MSNYVNVSQELEQEKYHLRRRLEVVEEEYELKVTEFQTDITGLRSVLQQTETNNRQAEREKSLLITQLSEQNQRLTGELEAAARREEELARQREELRAQFQDKRETMRDHVMHLETLKDEVGSGANAPAAIPGEIERMQKRARADSD